MSYRSRLYNHRNTQLTEVSDKPFFSKQHDGSNAANKGAFFQAKLSVNQPGDQYEREADHVAHAVVNNKTTTPVLQHKKISSVQRLSTPMEDEKLGTNDERMKKDKDIQEKPIQRTEMDPEKEKLKGIQKMEDPEKEKLKGIQKMDEPNKEEEEKGGVSTVQAKHNGTANTASAAVSSKIENSAGKGNKLPAKTMHEMSASFGVDFSQVHIHNDGEAADMNKELQAQAFTRGSNIYFNEGKYDPESTQGKFLLAHELTHVVQQQPGENNLYRKVNDNLVSCRNPTPDILAITGPDPVATLTLANSRSVELLDNVIDELQHTRKEIIDGGAPSFPVISDTLGQALQDRFQMDPADRATWTGTGEGTVQVLIRRFKMIRNFIDSGGLSYTCLAGAAINTPTCAGAGCLGITRAVSCAGNSRLFLCAPFWSDGTDEQAATLIHESFHMFFGFIGDSGHLANAHCYDHFVFDLNTISVSPIFANSCA